MIDFFSDKFALLAVPFCGFDAFLVLDEDAVFAMVVAGRKARMLQRKCQGEGKRCSLLKWSHSLQC